MPVARPIAFLFRQQADRTRHYSAIGRGMYRRRCLCVVRRGTTVLTAGGQVQRSCKTCEKTA